MFSDTQLAKVKGDEDVLAIYNEVRESNTFISFAKRFMFNIDAHVARNALWALTKATDKELEQLQPMLNEFIELAMQTKESAVRRLSLNIVERLKLTEDDLRTDFLDFCLEHMVSIEEFPGIQSLCMKIAYHMCRFYPELMDEFMRTIDSIELSYYKPALRCVVNRIKKGKLL
jgi:hypothetical protein